MEHINKTHDEGEYVDFEIAIDSEWCKTHYLLDLVQKGEILSGSGVDEEYVGYNEVTSELLEDAGLSHHKQIDITTYDQMPTLSLTVRYPKKLEHEIISRLDGEQCIMEWEIVGSDGAQLTQAEINTREVNEQEARRFLFEQE